MGHPLTKKLRVSGYNFMYVEECTSTNTLASEIVCAATDDLMEGMIVVTDKQTAGRGQHGNKWFSDAGMNLTFSIIRYPDFLDAEKSFYLNVIASLAVHTAARSLGLQGLKVKWPNDVYHFDKKICGILTECQVSGNAITSAVIGIGVNVNQKIFALPKAGSISLALGRNVCRAELLMSIIRDFDSLYSKLRQGHTQFLCEEYLSQL